MRLSRVFFKTNHSLPIKNRTKNKTYFPIQTRELHTLNSAARRGSVPEVIYANNVGIIGTFSSLKTHPQSDHPHVILVRTPFWLDNVLEEHLDRSWGQTLLSFPTHMRCLLKSLFPFHSDDVPVTWKMIKDAREHAVFEIKKTENATVIDLSNEKMSIFNKEDFSLNSMGSHYEFKLENSEVAQFSPDTHFYNWFRIARTQGIHDIIQDISLDQNMKLYEIPPTQVPDTMLLFGTGLSTVWVKKNFPDRNVIAVARNPQEFLEKIESNKEVDYENIPVVGVQDIRLKPREESFVIRLERNGKSKFVKIPYKDAFLASGFRTSQKLTEEVPVGFKTELANTHVNHWIAPENVPIGSFTQSLMNYYKMTGQYELTFEMSFGQVLDDGMTFLQRSLREYELNLEDKFFEILTSEIKTHKNHIPPEKELDLLNDIYEKSHPSATEDQKIKFKNALSAIQSQIKSRENSFTSSLRIN